MSFMRNPKSLVGLAALGLLTIISLMFLQRPQTALSSVDQLATYPTARAVVVGTLRPDFLQERYDGIVKAARTSDIASLTAARIDRVFVDVGDTVLAGQPLVRLDSRALTASVASARAELAQNQAILDELSAGARRQELDQAAAQVAELEAILTLKKLNHKRIAKAGEVHAIADAEVDGATHELDAAQARLLAERAKLSQIQEGARQEQVRAQEALVDGCRARLEELQSRLEDTLLIAPFDGSIQARFMDEGGIAAAGRTILTLVECAQLEVHIGLPSSEASEMASIQDMRFSVETSNGSISAHLERLAPALDPKTGTRLAVFSMDEPKKLAAGDAVTLVIERPVASASCWIPTSALITTQDNGWAVLAPTDSGTAGVFRLVEVKVNVHRMQAELCEVHSELGPGSLVVSEGLHRFVPQQLVRIAKRETSLRLTSGQALAGGQGGR